MVKLSVGYNLRQQDIGNKSIGIKFNGHRKRYFSKMTPFSIAGGHQRPYSPKSGRKSAFCKQIKALRSGWQVEAAPF